MSTEEEREDTLTAGADVVDAEEVSDEAPADVVDVSADADADADAEAESAAEEVVAEVVDPEVLALRIELGAMQAKLEQAEQEKQDFLTRLKTVSAAYQKQKEEVGATRSRLERIAKEKEEIRRGEVVSKLFEPLENLRRAKDGMVKSGVDAGQTQGVEMVIKQIQTAFEQLGMEEVPGKGAAFDPNLHEALTLMPVQDPALHEVVVEVFETGYRIGSRLIRPARVIVGNYTAPEEPVAEA